MRGNGECEGGRQGEKQREGVFANMKKGMFINGRWQNVYVCVWKKHSFSLLMVCFPLCVCYVYLVSSSVGYVLLASLSLFVCVCHRWCISVQGLLATDGFHNHRHHHHLQYDSSIFLLFWRIYFPLRGRKRNKNTFTFLLSVEMASKMWTKTLQVWCCWRTFFFFSLSLLG